MGAGIGAGMGTSISASVSMQTSLPQCLTIGCGSWVKSPRVVLPTNSRKSDVQAHHPVRSIATSQASLKEKSVRRGIGAPRLL